MALPREYFSSPLRALNSDWGSMSSNVVALVHSYARPPHPVAKLFGDAVQRSEGVCTIEVRKERKWPKICLCGKIRPNQSILCTTTRWEKK